MIKRIELINFMSHERTVIEPADGLTVLSGPNNCGKSAVVAALQILCHNDNSTYVLKHQEKNCRIIVETQDGHVIEWSRKKNGSPKYLINDKPYDRLKKGVPPELHAALRLPRVASDTSEFDIHFGEQKKPIFLLNDSPKAAAEFFASSSDAIRLVEMQALHKQKVRDAKREHARMESERTQIDEYLDRLGSTEQLQKCVETCEKEFFRINVDCDFIETSEDKLDKIEGLQLRIDYFEAKWHSFESLNSPPQYAETEALRKLTKEYSRIEVHSQKNDRLKEALCDLPDPPVLEDEEQMSALIDECVAIDKAIHQHGSCLQELARIQLSPTIEDALPLGLLIESLEQQRALVDRLEEDSVAAFDSLEKVKFEIEEWASANPVCPTCHGKVDLANLVSDSTSHRGRPSDSQRRVS